VFGEPLAQLTGIVANNVVFGGEISRSASKYPDTDLLLGNLVLSADECLAHDVEQEFAEQRRLRELTTSDNAFGYKPARIVFQVLRESLGFGSFRLTVRDSGRLHDMVSG
jgi:hypothetical protein